MQSRRLGWRCRRVCRASTGPRPGRRLRVLQEPHVARCDAAWVSGLALLLIAGIGGCEARGMPVAGRARRAAGPVTVYVANEAQDTVTPIRAAGNTAGRPIKVGRAPALI